MACGSRVARNSSSTNTRSMSIPGPGSASWTSPKSIRPSRIHWRVWPERPPTTRSWTFGSCARAPSTKSTVSSDASDPGMPTTTRPLGVDWNACRLVFAVSTVRSTARTCSRNSSPSGVRITPSRRRSKSGTPSSSSSALIWTLTDGCEM